MIGYLYQNILEVCDLVCCQKYLFHFLLRRSGENTLSSCRRERSVTQQRRWRVWGTVFVARVAAAEMESRGHPKKWYSQHICSLLVLIFVSDVSVRMLPCHQLPVLPVCSTLFPISVPTTEKLISFKLSQI